MRFLLKIADYFGFVELWRVVHVDDEGTRHRTGIEGWFDDVRYRMMEMNLAAELNGFPGLYTIEKVTPPQ